MEKPLYGNRGEQETITSEHIIDEVHSNIAKDREKIEKFYEKLERLSNRSDDQALECAEPVAKLIDCLTKVNAQLIELAKVRSKKDPVSEEDGINLENIYDEIQQGTEAN